MNVNVNVNMNMNMNMNRLLCHLLGCRAFISFPTFPTLPSFPASFLAQKFYSTLIHSNTAINTPFENPFAQFATTKLNMSPADIAQMFKFLPRLSILQTLEKVEQFVDMLNKHGFDQHQIASIMKHHPQLLNVSAERKIEPKIQLLKDFGITGKDLAKILTIAPRILGSGLERVLIPNIKFIRDIFHSHDLFIRALFIDPFIIIQNLEKILKPSFAFWEGCGARGVELAKFLLTRRGLLRFSSLTPAQVELIQMIGINKESKMYKHVLGLLVASRIDTLKAKMHNLQMCGLSTEETLELFRVSPYVYCLSTERVRKNIDFVVNKIDLPANSVVKHSYLLKVNLEKVLMPRFLVWVKIKSTNELGLLKNKSFLGIFIMSEAYFVNKIIKGHPESTALYAFYEKTIANASSQIEISRKDS